MADYSQLQVLVNANTAAMSRDIASAASSAGDNASKTIGQKLTSGLGSAAKAVGNTIATGFTVAVGAAAGFGTAVIASGASYNVLMQKSNAAFKTILGSGDAANKMMADLGEFAKTSPFPRQAFIEATQQMLAFGFNAKDVIPTLDAIQNAVAATGGSAEQIGEITNVLSQVQSTGKFTADTLNQLGFRGIDAAALIAKGFGTTAADIRSQITKGTLDSRLALKVLVDQMANTYAGAAEGVKNTWVGATDRIRGAMRDIGSAIVEPFISKQGGGIALDWANRFADLLRALEPLFTPVVNALMTKIGPALNKAMGYLDKVIDRVTAFVGSSGAVKTLGDAFSQFAPVLAPVAGLLLKVGGANIGAMLGPLGPLVQGVTGAFGPFGMALGAIVATSPAARAGLSQIGRSLIGLVGPVMDLVRSLGQALAPIIEAIVPVIVGLFGELIGIVKALMPAIAQLVKVLGGALGAALKDLAPVVTQVVGILGGELRQVLPDIAKAFGQIVKAVVPILPPLLKLVGVILPPLAKILALVARAIGFVANNLDAFLPLIVAVGLAMKANAIATTAMAVAQKVVMVAQGAWNALTVITNALMAANPVTLVVIAIAALVAGFILLYKNCEPVQNAVGAIWDALKTGASAIGSFVSGAIGAIVSAFKAVVSAAGAVVSWVKSNWPYLVGALGGPMGLAAAAIIKNFDAVKKGLSAFGSAIKSGISDIIGVFTEMPGRIVSSLSSLGGSLTTIGRNAISSMRNGIDATVSTIWAFFSNLPGAIVSKVTDMGDHMFTLGKGAITSIRNGIDNIAGSIWAFFSNLPGTMVSKIVGMGEEMFAVGKNVVQSIVNGIESIAGSLWAFFTGLPGAMISRIVGMADRMYQIGAGVVNAIRNGIGSAASSIFGWARNLPGRLAGAVGNIGSRFFSIGQSIVNGIKNGIWSMGKSLANAVVNFAKKFIPGPIRKALKIGSPSKLMRDEVGKMIVAGLVEGIDSGGRDVSRAMTNLVDLPSPAATVGSSADALGATATAAGPAVAIDNAYFSEQADIDLLLRRATWAVRTGS
jgi:tape measure domain-containing protein